MIIIDGSVKRYYYEKGPNVSRRPSMISEEAASKYPATKFRAWRKIKGEEDLVRVSVSQVQPGRRPEKKLNCAPGVILSAMHPVNRHSKKPNQERKGSSTKNRARRIKRGYRASVGCVG
jgi:hypothetical protein